MTVEVFDVEQGRKVKHGMRYTPEYSSWTQMKNRCLCPSSKDYQRWGGKGVAVCAEWVASFEAFYSHIGPKTERNIYA